MNKTTKEALSDLLVKYLATQGIEAVWAQFSDTEVDAETWGNSWGYAQTTTSVNFNIKYSFKVSKGFKTTYHTVTGDPLEFLAYTLLPLEDNN